MSILPRFNLSSKFFQAAFLVGVVAAGHFIAYKMLHVPAQSEMVLILAICFFYPILRYPLIGVYLLFAIMPFIPFFRRLYYLQFIRPTADPLIIIGDIIISMMILGLFFEFRERKDKDTDTKAITWIIFLYFIYLIIRTFYFNSLPLGESVMRFRLYGPSVLLFFLGTMYAQNYGALKKIWLMTVIIGVGASLYGFKQLLIGYSESERIWFSSISFTTLFIKGVARPFSFFQAPASFADYMQISIIGVIVLISWSRSILVKYFYFIMIPLFFYGALITSVRSNWIGIVISGVVWLVLLQLKSLKTRIIVIVIIAALFTFTIVTEATDQAGLGIGSIFSVLGGGLSPEYADLLVTERAGAISDPFEEHSMLSRIALWKYIFVLSRDPILALLGRGVGTLNADSLYVTYLAELGYPGAFFILAFVIFLIVKGFSLLDKARTPEVLALAKGIVAMNIVFAVINITGTHIHSFPGDAYFWFWNGVLIKLEAINRKNTLIEYNETTDYN